MSALPTQLGAPDPCRLCPSNASQPLAWRYGTRRFWSLRLALIVLMYDSGPTRRFLLQVHSGGKEDPSVTPIASAFYLMGHCRPSFESSQSFWTRCLTCSHRSLLVARVFRSTNRALLDCVLFWEFKQYSSLTLNA